MPVRSQIVHVGLWLLLALLLAPTVVDAEDHPDGSSTAPLNLYLFVGQGCPHCEAQTEFLQTLVQQQPRLQLHSYEVFRTREHHHRYIALALAHGLEPGSVPTLFIGGRGWVGDGPAIRREINRHIDHCLQHDCPDPGAAYVRGELLQESAPRPSESATTDLTLPLIGTIDLATRSLVFSTAVIAFIDGFNPCSIWVLTLLLALVLHSRSRWRVLLVSLTFLTTTAAIYGLFISGTFGVMSFIGYLTWITWLVVLLALIFAVVNIKDYFWFQRGLSFTIDARHKPGLYRRMRGLLSNGRNPLALVGATAAMAAGIALIELPCTAGLPVIWSSLLARHELGWPDFTVLLALYLLIYLAIELAIIAVALVTLRIGRFDERHGRWLKLLGGVIMFALAVVLLTAPERMSDLSSAVWLFAIALAATGLIVVLHRWLLPRFGIRIGDGWNAKGDP